MSYVCFLTEEVATVYRVEGSEDNEPQRRDLLMHLRMAYPAVLVKMSDETITHEQYQAMALSAGETKH